MTPDWPVPGSVRALVTRRAGGVSEGPYATLNLGERCGDDPASVAENRRRLRAAARLPAEPVWLRQVHGVDVVELDAGGPVWTQSSVSAETPERPAAPPDERRILARRVEAGGAWPPVAADAASRPLEAEGASAPDEAGPASAAIQADAASAPIEADAAVTATPGVVCAVLTADCLPVFLAACDGTRVGVAHAGWRGLAAGVLERAVAAMGVAPAGLVAWLGPAIGPEAFEVGGDVVAAFRGAGLDTDAAIRPNARGRWQADLYALARQSLERASVRDVRGGGFCTHAEAERFFSHRRDGPCGRFASLIWID